jgi:PAS domain S-box-containing protein
VLDQKSSRIILVNSRLTEMTAYTRQELYGQEIRSLLVDFQPGLLDDTANGSPISSELPLKRRSGQIVQVIASSLMLDPQKKWVMLTLETAAEREQQAAEESRQKNIWPAVCELACMPQLADDPNIIDKALEAGSRLTGANLLVIYLGEGKDYLLTRRGLFGDPEIMPDQVSPQDLISLQAPHIWAPRRRALSTLHHSARQSGLSYLATAPLGQMNALIGLIAAGGAGSPPPERILDHLDILGSTITNILQNQSVSTALSHNQQMTAVQQAVFSAVQEKVQDGVIVLNPDLQILELNAAAESILGYQTTEVRGQPIAYILVGAGEPVPDFLVSSPGVAYQDMGSHRLFRRDGEVFLAGLKASPVFVNNTLRRILVVIHDLTQEEQYREQSQKLEQRAVLGELNAIFAHEVRNPINNISTGLQVLAVNLPEDDPSQEVISRMIADCERVADLMKSVLSFIKQMEYKMEPVNLNDALKRLLDRWRPTMAKYKIEYEIFVEPGTPPAEGDVRALEHVWNNLISNAIQAMNQNGGKLSVKVRPIRTPENTPKVEVSIHDTGGGIPDDIRERIFEPFFTTQSSGTGLGLAITQRIVTAHKGTIHVVSVYGGTVFQVQLPVSAKSDT